VFLRLHYPGTGISPIAGFLGSPARLPLGAFHREPLPFVAKLMPPPDFRLILNARR
jgi:hypothetical protein